MSRIADRLYRWADAELAWLYRLCTRAEAACRRLEKRWSR
jgi:hypothetical protein